MPARDKQTATENVQVLMFYPLGKNLEKTQGGSGNQPTPLPSPLVLPRVNHDL